MTEEDIQAFIIFLTQTNKQRHIDSTWPEKPRKAAEGRNDWVDVPLFLITGFTYHGGGVGTRWEIDKNPKYWRARNGGRVSVRPSVRPFVRSFVRGSYPLAKSGFLGS